MYEQTAVKNSDIKFLGIKLFEIIIENTTVFEREVLPQEKDQNVLANKTKTTIKFLGIPIIRHSNCYDFEIDKTTENNSDNSKKFNKSLIFLLLGIVTLFIIFILGIITANSRWFNNVFYIQSRNIQNLEIKSLKPYNKAYEKAKTQYDMNIASQNRYEHYHEYYNKVVERIKTQIYFPNTEKSQFWNILTGTNKEKNKWII